MNINGNPRKSTKINENQRLSTIMVQNAPRAPKILPGPSKISHFLLHSKGVAGVAAGVVNPATPWCRVKTGRLGILSLILSLHGPCAFRRARLVDCPCGPFGPQNRPKNLEKSMKIDHNRPQSTKIDQHRLKSTTIHQNQRKSTALATHLEL